jgi:hypothetical protein
VLRRYYFGDFARKVVGVGSVGTEAFVVLLMGDRDDEPLFLQLKEAQESVLAPFAGPSEYQHQGERVVRGQRLTQAAADPFLGWTKGIPADQVVTRDYYVRQLRDMKGSMNVPAMDAEQLSYYTRLCGWALSRAHARSCRASMTAGYLGNADTFDRRSSNSPAATPTRTSWTTAGWWTRCHRAGSRRSSGCSGPGWSPAAIAGWLLAPPACLADPLRRLLGHGAGKDCSDGRPQSQASRAAH